MYCGYVINMKTKVEFESNGLTVIAKGNVSNTGIVSNISLDFPDLTPDTRISKVVVDDLMEEAEMLLLDKTFTPELDFED